MISLKLASQLLEALLMLSQQTKERKGLETVKAVMLQSLARPGFNSQLLAICHRSEKSPPTFVLANREQHCQSR